MRKDCVLFIGPLKRSELAIIESKKLIDKNGTDLSWQDVLPHPANDILMKIKAEEWLIKEKREIISEDHIFFAMNSVEQQLLFDLGFFRRKAISPLAVIYIDYEAQFFPTYRTHCQGIVDPRSVPASELSVLREDGNGVPSIETFKNLIKLSIRNHLEANGPFTVGPTNFLLNPVNITIPEHTRKYLILRHSYGIQICDRVAHIKAPGTFHPIDSRIYPGKFRIDELERISPRRLEELREANSTFQYVYEYMQKIRQRQYAKPILYIIHHFYPFA